MEPPTPPKEPALAPIAEHAPITIKLDETRQKLNEGRCYGVGFAFLKKMADGVFEAVQPMSTCKDYLNDVVYSEHTGKPFHIYGLSTAKRDIFDTHAYMVFSVLTDKYGSKHETYDSEVQLIETNLPNTQKLLNEIELMLGIKGTTMLTKTAYNQVLATIPLEWVASTWMISLWALLARNAIFSKGGDALTELKAPNTSNDAMYMGRAIERIKAFAEKGLPKQNWETISQIHGNGIFYMYE